jgi:crossover junction endodeoxyribonuclease RuvC
VSAPLSERASQGITVLGIDPGIARTGFGILRLEAGRARLVHHGLIATDAGPDGPRLVDLSDRLAQLILEHAPDEAALERLYFGTNARSALQVGQARGVAVLTLVRHAVPVSEYTPMQVKEAITGHGGAGKAQVEQMVRRRLQLSEQIRPDDVADALAVALCHSQGRGLAAAMTLAASASRGARPIAARTAQGEA